ncbi:MAG: MmcQ/YjbR family DNA-binding protein [Bacteroidia bacterium]
MNIESIREYCLKKNGVTESFPFGEDVLVFKVMDKIFLLTSLSEPHEFNVKCDPEYAIELREKYDSILPGYHMNKKHWNTVNFYELPEALVLQLIDHSYQLVKQSLTKKLRDQM